MKGINDNHLGSSVREKTAGKLPEDSKKHTFSKGDARYWGATGRLFKDHGVADYSCRFSVRGQRAQIYLDTSNQKEVATTNAFSQPLVSVGSGNLRGVFVMPLPPTSNKEPP